MGIGGGALVVAALGMGANADSGSDAGLVFGGVTLGIGIVALSTAGILTVMHEYEEEQVRVRAAVGPVGAGLELRF
jgi:hypothetical protein